MTEPTDASSREQLDALLDSSSRIHGRVVVVIECLSPMSHGGGTEGNIQTFRKRDVVLPSGRRAQVPFLSGNSIKHMLREKSTLYALEHLGALKPGGLTKPEVQLLFSGGTLTKSGRSVALAQVRKMEQAFPALSLSGYAAGNVMTESAMNVHHAELVCVENARLLYHDVQRYAPFATPLLEQYASKFLAEEFGTRHEPTRRARTAELLLEDQLSQLVGETSANKDKANPDKGDSAQMIFAFETLAAGSVMLSGITFPRGLTMLELAAFRSAWRLWAQEREEDGAIIGQLGGKGSTGYGRVRVRLHGQFAEGIKPRQYFDSSAFTDPLDAEDDILRRYEEHLSHARETWSQDVQKVLT